MTERRNGLILLYFVELDSTQGPLHKSNEWNVAQRI